MKRFYKQVTVDDDLAVLLDGKPLLTPAKARLILPTRALADAIAQEWRGQGETIKPDGMKLTKLANTAIDRAGGLRSEIEAELLGFGRSDLTCYHAEGPGALVARQREHWGPLHDWLELAYGARLKTAQGIVHVEQDARTAAAFARALAALDAWTLAALQTLTTVTGSLVLGLAVVDGRLTAGQAFALSRIDEAWQAEQWGLDSAAEQRAREHAKELEMAAKFLSLARA